jgi:cytochrome c biogenesis protein CcdA
MAPLLLALLLFPTRAWPQTGGSVEISPPIWKFGMVDQGTVVRTEVRATNLSGKALRLGFVATCDCLTVSPDSALLAPGASASFALSFDTTDYSGITTRGFIVNGDAPGMKPLYYKVYGVVRVERKAPAAAASPSWGLTTTQTGPSSPLLLSYYYTKGCRSCEEFLSVEIPKLETSLGLSVVVARKDILEPANFEELSRAAQAQGQALGALPALVLAGKLIQGDERIREGLPGLLKAAKTAEARSAPEIGTTAALDTQGIDRARLAILPVIAAGLIDGVNPCAFTTLIFLLASLALAGRGRREVLAIGALFSLGVFLTYLAVGFGLFTAIRAASGIALASTILRWLLFAALAVFAALSVYDFFLIRAGKASEMILQLPKAIKGRIHASIRTRTRSLALAGSSLVLGFLVSIFEFACTGQVYLPTLAYLARVQRRADAFGLLLLYNLCFIAPLLLVFAASYLGVSSKRITSLFQAHMGKVKLALALAFLVLAALTVLT